MLHFFGGNKSDNIMIVPAGLSLAIFSAIGVYALLHETLLITFSAFEYLETPFKPFRDLCYLALR
jgi:hypothetical protein